MHRLEIDNSAGAYVRGTFRVSPSWFHDARLYMEEKRLRDMAELKNRRPDNDIENVYATLHEGGKIVAIVYASGMVMVSGLDYSQLPSSGRNLRDVRLASLQKMSPGARVLYGDEAREAAIRSGY